LLFPSSQFQQPKGNLSDNNNNNHPWDLLSPWTFLLSLDFSFDYSSNLYIQTFFTTILQIFKSGLIGCELVREGKSGGKEEEKQKQKKKKKIIQVKFFGTHTITFFVISLSHSNKPLL